MKTTLIPLTLLLLTLSACQKEEESFTQISGQVYEYNNGRPVPYAKVRFEWWNPATFGETRHFVDSTTADAQGNYSLKGDVPNGEEYYVIADAPSYFVTEETEVIRPNVKRGKKQTVNLDLIPYAWVRMNIRKTGEFDYMNIGPASGSTQTFTVFSDTTLITKALGNSEVGIMLFKYLNDYQTRKLLRVNTIGHDTVDISIEF